MEPALLLSFAWSWLFQPVLVLLAIWLVMHKTFPIKWVFLVSNIMCFPVFMMWLQFCCRFIQITHLHEHTLYSQNHRTKNYLVCSSFSQKLCMIQCFHKNFWEIKVLVQKKNQIGVVPTNKFWKFKWSPRKVTIHLQNKKPENNPNTLRWLQKMSFFFLIKCKKYIDQKEQDKLALQAGNQQYKRRT
jgi:hypothetical protein